MRRWLFLVVPLLVAGCATWGQNGLDGGRSFDNRADGTISPANVGQLHEVWKLPGSTPAIGGGNVFDSLNPASPLVRHALVAYPETGCAASGVPTCAESWSIGGRYSPPATDGTSVFAVNLTDNVLHVLAVNGTPTWTYTPAAIAGSTTVLAPDIRIDNGKVWLQVEDTTGGGSRTDRLVSLPAAGCGSATCAATLTIGGAQVLSARNDNGVDIGAFVATEGVVLATRLTDAHLGTSPLFAYDPGTGAERWHSSENAIVLTARDGRAYAHLACESTGCTPGVVYPLLAGANCTGTPKVCTAVASITQMGQGPVLTEHHAVVAIRGTAKWYSNTCTGTCSSLAQLIVNSIPNPYGYAAAGSLVFSAGSPSLNVSRIYAVDDSLSNCPGAICVPTFTTDATSFVNGLAVNNGRLYASESDGFVHVYGL